MSWKELTVRQYLNEIKSRLYCPKSVKAVFLKELKERIKLSYPNRQGLTKEMLYAQFGTPEEISDSFFDRENYESFLHKSKAVILRWKLIGFILSAMLILVTILLVLTVQDAAGKIIVSDVYSMETEPISSGESDGSD